MTSTLTPRTAEEHQADPLAARLAFDAAIDQLIQPNMHTLLRDSGAVERALAPCLIDQLVTATQPGTERTGGSARGSRPPASLNALALVAEISQTLRAALAALGHDLFGTGARPSLTGQLRLWASHAGSWQLEDVDYLAYAAQEAERWVTAGRSVLNPAPAYRLRGHACPTCRHTTVLVWSDTEQEWLRRPALSVDTDRVETVCAACDSRWGLEHWAQLGKVLDSQRAETLALDCE
ncbi:hypothetical protein ABT256_14280 [Amycolatopsis japonica]|uniref:DUF7341 domain-containing protein n=1 Tax=Amycolatopsis japonica TaxID=208439 RepID=UPI00331E062D